MLLSELVNGTKTIKDIKVKEYLPIVEKMFMINGIDSDNGKIAGIIDQCIEEKDGMFFVDYFKEVAFVVTMVKEYTDIELDEVELPNTVYDYLITSGIWDKVKNEIPTDEKCFIINTLNQMLEQEISIKNSISGVVSRSLNKLIVSMPQAKDIDKLLKKLPKTLESLSPESKELFKGLIEGKLK